MQKKKNELKKRKRKERRKDKQTLEKMKLKIIQGWSRKLSMS